MKAYILGIRNDPDQGNHIVFAPNATEAKKETRDLMYDRWIDIQALRYPSMDGKENLKESELILELWRNHGWRWWDVKYPDPDESTDEQFLKWWHDMYDRTCEGCKERNETVRGRYCGYHQEVQGKMYHEVVCDKCEDEHYMDI